MGITPRLNTVKIEVIVKGTTYNIEVPFSRTLSDMEKETIKDDTFKTFSEKIQKRILRNLGDMLKYNSPYLKDNDTDGSYITVACVYKR